MARAAKSRQTRSGERCHDSERRANFHLFMMHHSAPLQFTLIWVEAWVGNFARINCEVMSVT